MSGDSQECFHNLLPGYELGHAREGEHEADMEEKMEKCPELLANRTKMVAVDSVKIKHVE
jgi:hypothetical protein